MKTAIAVAIALACLVGVLAKAADGDSVRDLAAEQRALEEKQKNDFSPEYRKLMEQSSNSSNEEVATPRRNPADSRR